MTDQIETETLTDRERDALNAHRRDAATSCWSAEETERHETAWREWRRLAHLDDDARAAVVALPTQHGAHEQEERVRVIAERDRAAAAREAAELEVIRIRRETDAVAARRIATSAAAEQIG